MSGIDTRVLILLNITISEEAYKLISPLILESLTLQDNYNYEGFVPIGGTAFELLIDNNIYLTDPNFSKGTNDLDLGYYTKDNNAVNDKNLVNDKLNEFVKNKIKNIESWKISILLTIVLKIVINVEQIHNIDLNIFKPVLDEIDNDVILQPPDYGFDVIERQSVIHPFLSVYTIVYNFRGLRIKLAETSESIYKNNGTNLIKLVGSLWTLSPSELIKDLYKLLNDPKLFKKHKKYTDRLNILIKNYNDTSPNLPIIAYTTPTVINFDIVKNNIITPTIQHNLVESRLYIENNQKLRDYLNCYSYHGDRYINNYLLQKEIFNESNIDISKEIITNNKNPLCIKYNEPVETICNTLSKYINDRIFILPHEEFVTWRITKPSLYKNECINNFKINDRITFSTFISTSYDELDNNKKMFGTIYSPLVLFKFIIKPTIENYRKFLFIESASSFPNESEVIFVPDSEFIIVDKKFITVKINNSYMQKLLFTLELNPIISTTSNTTIMLLPDDDNDELINMTAYLLRNKSGIQLTKSINNCKFIDNSLYLFDKHNLLQYKLLRNKSDNFLLIDKKEEFYKKILKDTHHVEKSNIFYLNIEYIKNQVPKDQLPGNLIPSNLLLDNQKRYNQKDINQTINLNMESIKVGRKDNMSNFIFIFIIALIVVIIIVIIIVINAFKYHISTYIIK
jgi:hypothetical protein